MFKGWICFVGMFRNPIILAFVVLLGALLAYFWPEPVGARDVGLPQPEAAENERVGEESTGICSEPRDRESVEFLKLAEKLFATQTRRKATLEGAMDELFEEWAAHDPRAAFAFRESHYSGDYQFIDSLLRGWAQSDDPRGAWEWVVALGVGEGRSTSLYSAVVQGLGIAGRRELAIELIGSLDDGSEPEYDGRRGAVSALMDGLLVDWARKDLAGAASWIEENESMLSEQMREGVLSGYARTWASEAPEEANAWAMALPEGAVRAHVLEASFSKWAQLDAGAAARWILAGGGDLDGDRLWVVGRVGPLLAHIAPEVVFGLYERSVSEGAFSSPQIGQSLRNLMMKAPAVAPVWLEWDKRRRDALAGEGQKRKLGGPGAGVYGEMIARWMYSDSDAAMAYLEGSPLFEEKQRQKIRADVLERLEPPDARSAWAALYHRWSDVDFRASEAYRESYLDWRGAADELDYVAHYEEIAKRWALVDPQQAAFFVERQTFLDAETTRALLDEIAAVGP